MQQEWLNFFAALAWPLVGLIALFILGPGGLLKDIITQLSSVATSIDELKSQVRLLAEAEVRISQSTQQVSDLRNQLSGMETQLTSIRALTADLVSQSFAHVQREGVDESNSMPRILSSSPEKTPAELYDMINAKWAQLCDSLRSRDDQFDARSVGESAWRLTDKRRKNPLSSDQAEQIDMLFSNMKRFRRLQSSMNDWLTIDVFERFAAGVEEAVRVLKAR